MIKPRILARGPFSPEDIKIKYNRISKRKIDDDIETSCKRIWKDFYKKAKEEGKVIYDGTSYRMDSLMQKGKELEIAISEMKFSIKKPLSIQIDCLEKFGIEYFPNTIAIGGPLYTIDNKFIFGQKSKRTVSLTDIDIIGGVAETDILLEKGRDLLRVVEKEMLEETNISAKFLLSHQFLGIILSPWANVIFLVVPKLKINSNKAIELFNKKHDLELKNIIVIDEENLRDYLNGLGGYKHLVAELMNEFNPH